MPEKSNSDLSVVSSYDFDYEQQQISIQKKVSFSYQTLFQLSFRRKKTWCNIARTLFRVFMARCYRLENVKLAFTSWIRFTGEFFRICPIIWLFSDIFSRDLSEDLKSMGYSNMIELNDDPSNNLEVLRLPDDTFIVKSLNLPTSSETLVNSIISQEKTWVSFCFCSNNLII